jgi:5-methylcytosine-specific restriction endonuclease McrA
MTPHNTDPLYLKKEAKRIYDMNRREQNKEAMAIAAVAYYQKNKTAIRAKRAEFEKANPDRLKEQYSRYYYANQAARAASKRAYYKKNRGECLARGAVRYQKNKEAKLLQNRIWYKNNKDSADARRAKWRKENPAKVKFYSHKRISRKLGSAGNEYTSAEHISARFEVFGGRCWMCGSVASSMDHVKPLSKGGSHWPSNLRPACRSCNSQKSAKWPYNTSTKIGA